MFYVYIIQSEKDNSFYIGYTDNLDRRIYQHNNGNRKCYTKNKRPWKIVYHEYYDIHADAMKREKEIKNRKSKKYILSLISASS